MGLGWFGDTTTVNNGTYGSESLNEGNFATTTKWTAAGDFAFSGAKAVYTDSSHAGTITQTSGNMAIAGVGNRLYKFVYTTSSVTGAPVCTVTTGFLGAAFTLAIPAGTYTVYFVSKATPGSFVISCTSVATETVSFDDLSLTEAQGGDFIAGGNVSATSVNITGGITHANGVPCYLANGTLGFYADAADFAMGTCHAN